MNVVKYIGNFYYSGKAEKQWDFKMKPCIVQPLCRCFQVLREEDEEWNKCEGLGRVIKDQVGGWLQEWDGVELMKGEEMIKGIREAKRNGCLCGGNCFAGLEVLIEWGFWIIGNGVFVHALSEETIKG